MFNKNALKLFKLYCFLYGIIYICFIRRIQILAISIDKKKKLLNIYALKKLISKDMLDSKKKHFGGFSLKRQELLQTIFIQSSFNLKLLKPVCLSRLINLGYINICMYKLVSRDQTQLSYSRIYLLFVRLTCVVKNWTIDMHRQLAILPVLKIIHLNKV